MDVPEFPSWLLDASVSVNDEGEEDSEGNVDVGVEVPEVVDATVIAGRNLPSGPLLIVVLCFASMTQGPLSCNKSARGLTRCTINHDESTQNTREHRCTQ